MYKIFYNDTLIFYDKTPMEELKLINPVLDREANSAGSLEFTMPPIHPAYNSLLRMRGIIKVEKNGTNIWEGRILSDDTDFFGNKKVYCEGELTFLHDTLQPQNSYSDLTLKQFIEAIISIHNSKVSDDKKFDATNNIVTVASGVDIGTRITNFETTWDILKSLVEEFGGYLIVRHANGVRYLDYRSECPRTSTQKIEFGENLMSFTKSYDMSSLVTAVLPLGKTIANSGQTVVGEKIETPLLESHYIDPISNYYVYYDPNLDPKYTATTYVHVESNTAYYVTCRNRNGRVMWALLDSEGNLVDHYNARDSDEFTDLVEYRIDVPQSDVHNYYQLAIAGYGSDIIPRINSSITASENFDEYVTVEKANVGTEQSPKNYGSMYVVNEEAVTNYGWIEKQITWSNIEDPNSLKDLAESYLRDGQFDEMTLSVTAIDLQTMGMNTDSIDILDEVQVVSKPHGLNRVFPVTKMSIDLSDPSKNTFTLGYESDQTLTGVTNASNNDIFGKLNSIPSVSATLVSAKNNASELIRNATSGILEFLYDEQTGNTTGMRLHNVADTSSVGDKGWLFNVEGIGYFGNGWDQPVTVAITGENGEIVANAITSGEMLADRIKGGTLGLGHWPVVNPITGQTEYKDGSIIVKDASGNEILQVNQNYLAQRHYTNGGSNDRSVVLRDGWIRGGEVNGTDTDTGISVDNYFSDGRGMSLESTNAIAILTPNLYVGANAGAMAKTITTYGIEIKDPNGKHSFSFTNGALTVYNWDPNDSAYNDIYRIAYQAAEDYAQAHSS